MQWQTVYSKRFRSHPACQRWLAESAKYPPGWAAAMAADRARDEALAKDGLEAVAVYEGRRVIYDLMPISSSWARFFV